MPSKAVLPPAPYPTVVVEVFGDARDRESGTVGLYAFEVPGPQFPRRMSEVFHGTPRG